MILAQQVNIGGSYSLTGPLGGSLANATIGQIIFETLRYVFGFAGFGLLLMIIWSGFTMMLSVGDSKKLEKGRATLTNAVIGFLLIFAAFWIVQIVGTVLGWNGVINGGIFQ